MQRGGSIDLINMPVRVKVDYFHSGNSFEYRFYLN